MAGITYHREVRIGRHAVQDYDSILMGGGHQERMVSPFGSGRGQRGEEDEFSCTPASSLHPTINEYRIL